MNLERWETLETDWDGPKKRRYLMHKKDDKTKCGWCTRSSGKWFCIVCGEDAPQEIQDMMLLCEGVGFPVTVADPITGY